MDALGQTRGVLVLRHPLDRQVLDRDPIKLVDAAAALMGEVAPSPADALMDSGAPPSPPC
jgi:hypothetical protein